MKLILTVDTEADNQWNVGAELTTDNLSYVPRFQALCEHFEFPPTYLCTYEVVTSALFKGTPRGTMSTGVTPTHPNYPPNYSNRSYAL